MSASSKTILEPFDMTVPDPITFVACVNDPEIFANNFLVSPCFRDAHRHQILIQKGFASAASAYNDAIERSSNDLIVFAHQDMIFPSPWLEDLSRAVTALEKTDPNWGVLGCYGMTADDQNRGHIYSQGRGLIGTPREHPAAVQTLDEIVLILRKSSGLRFDERIPSFHFYGADICLAAAKRGMKSYAIPAFCIHNTQVNLVLPQEFYQGYWALRKLWKDALPIQTTCIRVTRSNRTMLLRRVRESYLRYLRRKPVAAFRVKDGRVLLNNVRPGSGR
jgi:glycosyltransferase involved in cell wall biosynthesis